MKQGVRALRDLAAWIAIGGAFVLGASLIFSRAAPVERLELALHDVIARWAQAPDEAAEEVRLVELDDASIAWAEEHLGVGWPWPREIYGVLAERLHALGAKVIAFDLLLDQEVAGLSDVRRMAEAIEGAPQVVLGASLEGISRSRGGPSGPVSRREEGLTEVEAYARAQGLVRDGERVWVAPAPRGWSVWVESPEADLAAQLPPGAVEQDAAEWIERRFARGATGAFLRGRRGIFPSAPLVATAAGLGIVDQAPDRDGISRRHEPELLVDGAVVPSLPLAMWLTGHDAWARWRAGDTPTRGLPFDGRGLRVRFYGAEAYGAGELPAWRLLRDAGLAAEGRPTELAPDLLEGAYVIVAPAAVGLRDHKPSPIDPLHLGGGINAAALDGLLTGRWVQRLPPWSEALLLLLVVGLGVFLSHHMGELLEDYSDRTFGWILRAAHRWLAVAGSLILLIAALVGASLWLYIRFGAWLGVVVPAASLVEGVVFYALLTEVIERRDRRRIHDALGIYTNSLVASLVSAGGVRALDARRDDISVLFCDLADFTSISETLEPEALAQLLNTYLSEMTDVVLRHGGVVDKYIGDAIMAFSGWRETQPDHARLAVGCALEMAARLEAVRPALEARYGVELFARTGVNTGVAIVGNLGSRQKMSVSLMGDVVNLAARLEGANKSYGTQLLVGEQTWRELEEAVACREIDLLRVKGKQRPTRVFEPWEQANAIDSQDAAWLNGWSRALALYREGALAAAREAFAELLEARPGDTPSQIYLERCGEAEERGRAEDWDGVHVLATK